jgi:hypothetical protein
MPEENEIEQRIKKAHENVDQACASFEDTANKLSKSGTLARWFDTLFRSLTAILAVASPALVTYSQSVGHEAFQLPAILITGIAGASATLQAIFGFRQSYIRKASIALEIRTIAYDLRSESEISFKQDKVEAIGVIKEKIAQARKKVTQKLLSLESALIKEYEISTSEA